MKGNAGLFKNKNVRLTQMKNIPGQLLRKILYFLIQEADTIAIISIMLGGIIAVGRESRAIGIGIAIIGFAWLLSQIAGKKSAVK